MAWQYSDVLTCSPQRENNPLLMAGCENENCLGGYGVGHPLQFPAFLTPLLWLTESKICLFGRNDFAQGSVEQFFATSLVLAPRISYSPPLGR